MNKKKIKKINKIGFERLNDPQLNKGTSFRLDEREQFNLHGLLPPKISNIKDQINRALENFRKKPNNLEKYIFLTELQNRNETLYYRLVLDNIEEMMPIIYTPTVGKACQHYGHIFRRPKGLYLSYNLRGQIKTLLKNWKNKNIEIIVCTDGERILGLGDLGANGMGIPVGKLVLYTVCAGVDPKKCLPITIDVGTNNQDLIDDPLYLGLSNKRVVGIEYENFIDEIMTSINEVFPKSIIQFEDFANKNALKFLTRYRKNYRMFNDDIQGTGCVVLAGVLASMRRLKSKIFKQKILFYGSGSAAIGIAEFLSKQMVEDGTNLSESNNRIFLFDSKGLVVSKRSDLNEEKKRYAKNLEFETNFHSVIKKIKPTIIIGASGVKNAFNKDIIKEMYKINDIPIIFALSNPTSNAECTAKDVMEYTKGKAMFGSGSPFLPIHNESNIFYTSQANNAYVFPGIGLGVLLSKVKIIDDSIFLKAAKTLSKMISNEDLRKGQMYPSIKEIRNISKKIASSIILEIDKKYNLEKINDNIYNPIYR